jgi:hypothetical protein
MQTKEDIEELMFLQNFISEHIKAGKLTIETSNEVEKLWNEYKQPNVDNDCAIISGDFGLLGSLVIRYITFTDDRKKLKYESGSYDFISVKTDQTKRILWTDYKDIEPYNRQSGLYCDGVSFEYLGKPVVEKPDYREFIDDGKYPSNISFGVWGFSYNDFYGSITFGISIKRDLVDEFILKLRNIINK